MINTKAYQNAYYAANVKRRADIRRYQKASIARNKAYVREYLLSHPCLVCKEDDPIVLEFDHRIPAEKNREISILVQRAVGLKMLEAEIRKCDVLCANCHRRKTFKQFNWK